MTELATTELDIVGIGAWSGCFSDFRAFEAGLKKNEWPEGTVLKPETIPPRERRRAPQTVKMAVEVMEQACKMAAVAPSEPAVVFASAMGDMQITDAMCSTVAGQPELVSPTRFHNSVHNAAIGYWSIATGSHQPATAVAGHDNSGAVGLLEAAVQCSEDNVPVIFVCQEGKAPQTLHIIRPSDHEMALSLLFVPAGTSDRALARLSLELVNHEPSTEEPNKNPVPEMPLNFSGNPAASLLPLLAMLAEQFSGQASPGRECLLPVNDHCALSIRVAAAAQVDTEH